MKQRSDKLMYMCVGAIIAFTAYMLGNLNESTNAQPQSQLPVIDKIVVRQLEIVDAQGNVIAIMGKRDLAVGMADILRVYDRTGKSVIALGQNANGGLVAVFGKEGKSRASLGIDTDGGVVDVFGKEGGQALLLTDKNGGTIATFNKDNRNVLQIGVTHTGGGVINTKDKFGYTTGSLP